MAQQERERRQARRLRAAELFAAGLGQAEAARQLGVSLDRTGFVGGSVYWFPTSCWSVLWA
jgi:hypothetical protein